MNVVVVGEVESDALLANPSSDGREQGGRLRHPSQATETPNLSNLKRCIDFDHRSSSAKFVTFGIRKLICLLASLSSSTMPHADTAFVPQGLNRSEFWDHVRDQLALLLDGERSWVSVAAYCIGQTLCPQSCISAQVVNLSNAASLIYNALLAYEPHFGSGERAVNWCGT